MALLQPRLNLKVSQKQILTPGLVQMVSVLALNKLELADMIEFGKKCITCLVDEKTHNMMQPWTTLLDDCLAAAGSRVRSARNCSATMAATAARMNASRSSTFSFWPSRVQAVRRPRGGLKRAWPGFAGCSWTSRSGPG